MKSLHLPTTLLAVCAAAVLAGCGGGSSGGGGGPAQSPGPDTDAVSVVKTMVRGGGVDNTEPQALDGMQFNGHDATEPDTL